MKYLIVLTALFLSFGVNADQQMNTNGGFCHFVKYNDGNPSAGNEYFASICKSNIDVQDGVATGTANWYFVYDDEAKAGQTADIVLMTGNTGINCNLVDSNNTTYTSTTWESEYKKTVLPDTRVSIRYKLYCPDATQ